ncbi:hypothetical protein GOP47_0027770 [Adiantum capillus-veneris]|nr:hypothetical protein GOP47_0027770 [Adiantum capillus-veneris]
MEKTNGTLPTTSFTKDDLHRKAAMSRKGIIAALAYMGCAVMLVMFNKAALSSYGFPCANVITLLQILCSNVLLYCLRSWNLINFGKDPRTDLLLKGLVPYQMLLKTSPLSIAYLFYMIVGMASIRGVNVPMYTTLRRTTVFFTLVIEYLLLGQKYSRYVVSSVGIIVLGALVAGSRDLSFNMQGYLIVILSNVTTAIYLTTIAHFGKTSGLNSFGLMWCNGMICGPVLFVWTLLSGELGIALNFPQLQAAQFQLVVIASCTLAFFLNYTIFLNTTLNSPLTQTICGNLKDLATVVLGWVWFGGLPFDLVNVLGQSLVAKPAKFVRQSGGHQAEDT